MKKFLVLGIAAFSIFVLIGCSSNTAQKTTYYDDKYIETLASGLDTRWSYSNSKTAENDKPLDRLKKVLTLNIIN